MSAAQLEPALLTSFLAVMEEGRVSAAARRLHLSQPAVTAQVRRLEEMVGAALFLRSAQGVTPTEAGLKLADYARSIRRLLDAAVSVVAQTPTKRGELRIGASTTVAAHVLPALLARFRGVEREVGYRVRIGNTDQIVTEVREGKIPLGIVEGHARASGVRLEPLMDDEIVAVMARDATFALRRVDDLASIPILWRESGSGTRAVVERALAKAGLTRVSRRALDIELGSTESILGGAVAGLGVAFVSRISARAYLSAGMLRTVPGLDLEVRRTFRWALPAGALTGTAARFYAFAQRQSG